MAHMVPSEPEEIISLIEWIESHGCLRTDDEMIKELGFKKRGSGIEKTICSAPTTRKGKNL